jgi:uncharacterized protein YecE (DUF72 family)
VPAVLRVGTSGFSYPKWRGAFYPADLSADDMLAFYASSFSAVEINNTFYRMPKASVLEGWAAVVPAEFRFVLKASRRITHQSRLRGVDSDLAYLYAQARALGPQLGGVLYQLPPFLRLDLELLTSFCAALPGDARAVIEFRHVSWFTEEVYAVLRAAGVGLCVADAGDGAPAAPLVDVLGHGYVRLRRPEYTHEELLAWRERITALWPDAYVFFMHEDDGEAPALAEQFVALP